MLVLAALSLLVVKRDGLWNDSLASMSPVSKELQALDQQLRNDMGAPDVRYMLVLNAADQESVLQQGEEIGRHPAQTGAGRRAGRIRYAAACPVAVRSWRARRRCPRRRRCARNLNQALRDLPFRSATFATFPQEVAQAKQQALLDRPRCKAATWG